MHRAFSVLTVKSLSDASRTFSGIATTPSTDRMGDVVEPEGAILDLPLPLLLHHDAQKPVGTVEAADVTRRGITVRCRVAHPDEPGILRDRCDEAWHSIKSGVIRGLSIGFRIIGDGIETLRAGGLRYTSFEIIELSLVAIPANSDATITAVKRYARSRRGGIPLFTADRRIGTGRKGVQLHPAQGSQAKRLARGDESTRSALDRAEALLRNADAVAGRQANISGRTALKLAAAGVFTLRDELDDLAERVEGIERGQR